ncbi:hypothetical protein AGMMS4957_11990 [Bacteroidia bacterium]|nr:hypothetical protein AGMMS4957_11990 [Bacteroidia bacterium]
MKFIDKTKRKVRGEKIVSDFLNEFHGSYRKNLYSEFKNPRRHELVKLLLEEQNSRCCYCMKSLDVQKDGISLEHLVPQSIDKKSKFDEYIQSDTVLNEENICLESDFIQSANPKFPPFPHTVAYQNLVVSCSGVDCPSKIKSEKPTHCNEFRGNKNITPIILYKSIIDEIEYKDNGFVIWKNDTEEENPTIETLGLNDVTLKMIRRIWLYAGNKHLNLLDLDTIQDDFLYDLLAEIDDKELEILLNFRNEQYWSLLKKYNYFSMLNILSRQLTRLKEVELTDLVENIKTNK